MSVVPAEQPDGETPQLGQGASLAHSTLAPSELRYLVVAAQREGNRLFARAVGELGLTPSHAEVIAVLDEWGPMSLRDLGEMIVCEAASPSRIVDNMVQRDLVSRAVDPHSRRSVILTLTDEGRSKLPAIRRIEQEMDHATSGHLTPDQQRIVSNALRGFLAHTPSGDALDRRFDRKRSLQA